MSLTLSVHYGHLGDETDTNSSGSGGGTVYVPTYYLYGF